MEQAAGLLTYTKLTELIITTSFSLLIFIIGFLINKKYDSIKEEKRLKTIKKYLLIICNDLSNSIDEQIIIYQSFGKKIIDLNNRDSSISFSSKINTDHFEKVANTDLFKLFAEGKKNKDVKIVHYFNFLHFFNVIKFDSKYSKEHYEYYLDNLNRYESAFKENVDKIFRKHDSLISLHIGSTEKKEDLFVSKFHHIVSNYRQIQDFSKIEIITNELVLKVLEHCKDFINDPRSLDILEFCLHSEHIVKELTNLRLLYSSFFLNHAEKMESENEKFKKAINYYKSEKYFN